MVVFILIGARVFSLVFQGVGGKEWIEHLLTSLPGGAGRLPDLRQHLHLRHRVLPRFLRDRLHHHPAAGAGRREARHRPDLVRRADLRQRADELHASAVRLCAVLPARHRAARGARAPTSIWGAIPWVFLQLILVVILIFWPGSVTYWLDKRTEGRSVDDRSSSQSAGSMPPPPRLQRRRSSDDVALTVKESPGAALRGFATACDRSRSRRACACGS